ncbi:Piso0_001113 [Millerozyma farinosa CBS 7064]|uniref:Piso0_001113 protein n=1 Tax=Pichia sorbitophila (strain ATCC MYA-4447 / BCRC 22081 / CBS 7064 / NBRC 10061 / NRRL Y-12695) TaxID=559304 RepID=G8YQZ1_PICSO|nr:Piso0_001113 [Millerozyma farinosa CBS 7064]CCE79076.1 Piso0_001113 [Millerozyma farinosa CBS 7064]
MRRKTRREFQRMNNVYKNYDARCLCQFSLIYPCYTVVLHEQRLSRNEKKCQFRVQIVEQGSNVRSMIPETYKLIQSMAKGFHHY